MRLEIRNTINHTLSWNTAIQLNPKNIDLQKENLEKHSNPRSGGKTPGLAPLVISKVAKWQCTLQSWSMWCNNICLKCHFDNKHSSIIWKFLQFVLIAWGVQYVIKNYKFQSKKMLKHSNENIRLIAFGQFCKVVTSFHTIRGEY